MEYGKILIGKPFFDDTILRCSTTVTTVCVCTIGNLVQYKIRIVSVVLYCHYIYTVRVRIAHDGLELELSSSWAG